MAFKLDIVRLVTLLDPHDRERDIEPVREDLETKDIDILYNVVAKREDYMNPTTDGELSWRSIYSYDTYSDEALNHWKNRLHEVSLRNY